ncbi:MAG: Uncharacterised protein [Gammaproteobacteria bacterium]|nr:MAG: Uncharacterised protein [Gammaproteobacteria bacterium]
MSRQYNEDEDKLITWFKENIKNIVYGVIIGLSLILSFQYYENSKSNKQYELSLEYQNVIDLYEDSNYKEVIIVTEKFKKNYPTNIYTAMIGLYEAKIHHENKEYNKSLNALDFIINNSQSKEIITIAQIRYARLLVLMNEQKNAKIFIMSIPYYKNNPLMIEILGDIEYHGNNIIGAKKYYESSLSQNLTPNKRKIIENKLNSIN